MQAAKSETERQRMIPEWAEALGTEYLPQCSCGCSMTWVGRGVSHKSQQRAEESAAEGELKAPSADEFECPACGGTMSAFWVFSRLPAGAARHPIFSPKIGHNSTVSVSDHLASVSMLTSYSRRESTRALEARGMKAVGQGHRKQGPAIGRWHASRARGKREWLERRLRCGAPYAMMTLTDAATGEVTERPLAYRCDDWRVCRECAKRRRWKAGEHATAVTRRVLSERAREYRRGYRGAEGRHSPRLITVTVPHGESLAQDVQLISDAWPKLLRKINDHYMDSCGRKPVWCRALEVTPGSDGSGHAHYHVWLFGPFIDGVLVRTWWGEILRDLGRSVPTRDIGRAISEARDWELRKKLERKAAKEGMFCQVPWPVTDVRGERDALDYLNKGGLQTYTQKGGEYFQLSPAHHALAYEALEGRRCVQWCRGYGQGRREKKYCVSFRKHTEEELKTLNDAMITRVSATRSKGTCIAETESGHQQSRVVDQSTEATSKSTNAPKSRSFLAVQLELM